MLRTSGGRSKSERAEATEKGADAVSMRAKAKQTCPVGRTTEREGEALLFQWSGKRKDLKLKKARARGEDPPCHAQ